MANATKQSLSLHPLAAAALNAVVPQEPGEKSCVPPLKLSKLQRKLAACRGDTEAFVHLCIVSIQLRQRHLTVAAEQFFQLALIGLNEHEAREALASDAPLWAGSTPRALQTRAVSGLKSTERGGVGLRKGKP